MSWSHPPGRPADEFRIPIAPVALVAYALVTLAYAFHVANPVIASDAWYFLDAFVRQVLVDGFDWRHLFVKRSGVDHSLPLHKLVLMANLKWFGLDFWIEGVSAAVLGFACAAYLVGRTSADAPLPPGSRAYGLVVAACGVALMSLNSTMIYTWPLVTQFFLTLPFFLLVYVAVDRFLVSRTPWALSVLALASILLLLVADNGGVIGIAAATGILVIRSIRTPDRLRWLAAVAVLVAIVLAVKLLPSLMQEAQPGRLDVGFFAKRLIEELPEAWKWILIPLASGVLHVSHFVAVFGEHGHAAQVAFGAAMLGAHVWFWRSWFRGPPSRSATIAGCLMVTAYLSIIAIVAFRVLPHFDSNYLHQHRYVATYQLCTVSLLMMLSLRMGEAPGRWRRGARAFGVAVAGIFLVLQAMLALAAWRQSPYIRNYHQTMARQLFALAADPMQPTPECVPMLVVCNLPAEHRASLVRVLSDHRLNVFSPAVRSRHGLPSPQETQDPAR